MFELLLLQPDSSDTSSSSEALTPSSQSSMSSDSCSSFISEALSYQETTPQSKSSPDHNQTLKPHRSSDSGWKAIRSAIFRRNNSTLNFKDFKIVKPIGSGDIGNVFLCHLQGSEENTSFYAMKVVDKDALAVKKKVQRAETERRILKMLDHPFLPTLYAEFEASHFSCVVMEFCSGGDLHTLRHKQPGKKFSLSSTRFYAAEVLVAMEYLHMLGIIYRDLKPENILVRSDGHIMLSDFDLSLCSDAIPAVESPDSGGVTPTETPLPSTPPTPSPLPSTSSSSSPFSCFGGNRLFRSRKVRTVTSNRQFVAEPVTARSCSFVGTHEYVSPEVAGGNSHGNAVDWWAFGIFIYELLYGRTPFAGETNEETLRNIVKTKLAFPNESPIVSASEMQARDLISGLLEKDPEKRLGSKRGAAEVKTHPFFKGLNFALVRSLPPPGSQNLRRNLDDKKKTSSTTTITTTSKSTAFDYF